MPGSRRLEINLRPATFDDAKMVADLESARDPEDPRDPDMLRFWWRAHTSGEVNARFVAEREGRAIAFVGAVHESWTGMRERFGSVRPVLHPDTWTANDFSQLVRQGEDWLVSEEGQVSVVRMREDFTKELDVLRGMGYVEVRRQKIWELDLVAGRERLLAEALRQRHLMQEHGVEMHPLSDDKDPDRLTKLYGITVEAEKDIPTTVPWQTMSLAEWKRFWFTNPALREDRFWIAREGEAIVGLSVLQFPPVRGLPWTMFTGTSRSVRGRGVARALKYETIAQAIELGYDRIRTSNDGANAPILHLNEEVGYRLVSPVIELHRRLVS
ncbi:MAG: GNAT family N-acetyltransferase [Candidatus Dormiibacterota bacterium]